jgi:hypothetical protein
MPQELTQEVKRQFFQALDEIVNNVHSGTTWTERKKQLLEGASEEEKLTLDEFASWFFADE